MRISKNLKKFAVYSLAGLFSLALHGFAIFLLLHGWTDKSPDHKPRRPHFIQATLIQMKPAAKAQNKQAARKKAAAAKKRAEQQRQQKARKKKEAQRKKAERKKADQKKARAEKTRRDKALKKKQAADKARKAAEHKQQAEREKQAKEVQRQEQQEELQRQARAQALASALDSEDEFLADEQSMQLAQGYSDYIQQRIIANWNRPLSARRGMEAILSIQLVPTGQVVGVSVIQSSGNEAFDLSAQQAVKKVGRFDKLQELSRQSPAVFEQNFRQFRLVFRPEDLRL
ncbi:MAG: cell envelope integrity protein TolA [Gammaproteobacteria bacterium]|nr:cell envelope integrity protein TolA [Gammaproteobacteria bacterium]MBQ0840714.1 cell envelope integrity protein TolA [Gammaproteobacteria bacterium]